MGLNRSSKNKDIVFHHVFQPIVHLASQTLHGYEALLRAEQFPSPVEFFHYARKHHLLFELDMESIDQALDTNWNIPAGQFLYINIFPSTIVHPTFLTRVQQMSKKAKISPSQVVLEINEGETIESFQALKGQLEILRQEGFRIALDDVGKGKYPLLTIVELGPDIIKFDRYFAKNFVDSTINQAYIEKMLHELGDQYQVVLEGLETAEDIEVAKQIGVDLGQGYYLGRPLPLEQHG